MFSIVIIQEHIDGDFARTDEKLQFNLIYVSFTEHHK